MRSASVYRMALWSLIRPSPVCIRHAKPVVIVALRSFLFRRFPSSPLLCPLELPLCLVNSKLFVSVSCFVSAAKSASYECYMFCFTPSRHPEISFLFLVRPDWTRFVSAFLACTCLHYLTSFPLFFLFLSFSFSLANLRAASCCSRAVARNICASQISHACASKASCSGCSAECACSCHRSLPCPVPVRISVCFSVCRLSATFSSFTVFSVSRLSVCPT